MEEKKKTFGNLIGKAIEIAEKRLGNYDQNDALTVEQLNILIESLKKDQDEVLSESIEPYQGQLFGPIKYVDDWGEPDGSELIAALHNLEVFYREHY